MKIPPLFAMTIAALAAQSTLAHTELAETVPADDATVAAAPEDVRLRFSEPVRLTALTIQKDGASKQDLEPLPTETTAEFTVAVPALDAGQYVVTWRALSGDTHVMSGEFMFTVGATDAQDAPVNDETEHTGENPEQTNQVHP